MPDQQHSDMVQQITGQVRSMFYLVDQSTTALAIQLAEPIIAVRAYGQLALDLRALPRGATIDDASHHELQIVAFTRFPA